MRAAHAMDVNVDMFASLNSPCPCSHASPCDTDIGITTVPGTSRATAWSADLLWVDVPHLIPIDGIAEPRDRSDRLLLEVGRKRGELVGCGRCFAIVPGGIKDMEDSPVANSLDEITRVDAGDLARRPGRDKDTRTTRFEATHRAPIIGVEARDEYIPLAICDRKGDADGVLEKHIAL